MKNIIQILAIVATAYLSGVCIYLINPQGRAVLGVLVGMAVLFGAINLRILQQPDETKIHIKGKAFTAPRALVDELVNSGIANREN